MQAINRTFAILSLISRHDSQIGVTRIANELGYSKSTVSRFLVALEGEGIITRSVDNRFSLGPTLLELTQAQRAEDKLISNAKTVVKRLNEAAGEAVALSILDGNQVTYLLSLPSRHAVQVVDWTGRSVPLHISSSGKLFLANQDIDFVDQYLSQPLAAWTEKSITDPAALQQHLQQIRQQTYATSDEEFALGVIGYAAPITDSDGSLAAALTIYGPKYRLEMDETILEQLQSCAREISGGLEH